MSLLGQPQQQPMLLGRPARRPVSELLRAPAEQRIAEEVATRAVRGLAPGQQPMISPGQLGRMATGLVPVLGETLDVYDAGKSLVQGDYLDAALSAVGFLPFVPGMAGMVTKVADDLPMDEAARMERGDAMGYDPRTFYRGDAGKVRDEYLGGAHFTLDPNYNGGGFGENREFRLNLRNTLRDDQPVTAGTLARIIEASVKTDPKLAADLSSLFDKSPEWMVGFGKVRPDDMVMESGSFLRAAIERSAAPELILQDAGFDAIMSGHEVRKLSGAGIRSKGAVFDPAKADSQNIMASLAAFFGIGAAALSPKPDQRWE